MDDDVDDESATTAEETAEEVIRALRDHNRRLRDMCLIGEQMTDIMDSMVNECKCDTKTSMATDSHRNRLDALRLKYQTLKDEHMEVAADDHHSMDSSLEAIITAADDSGHRRVAINCGDKQAMIMAAIKKSSPVTTLVGEDITNHPSFESIVDSIDSMADHHNNYLITIEGIDDTFYRDPTQDVKLEFVLPPMDDQLTTATVETDTTGAAVDVMTTADEVDVLVSDRLISKQSSDVRLKTINDKKSPNKSKSKAKLTRNCDKNNANCNNNSIINNNNNRSGNRVKCEWPGMYCPFDYPICLQRCSLEFRDKYNLSVHMVRHTGEKSFRCRIAGCAKTYATKAALDVHQNTHSDNRRFKCMYGECEAAFIRKTQLTVHISDKHTGLKPFRCNWPGCEYQACYLNRLQSHKLRHTGEKPYKCGQCEWSFRLSHHLKTHMLKHTGERPHECPNGSCGKRFQSKQAMRTHFKRTHAKL